MIMRRKWLTVLTMMLVLTLVPTATGAAFFSKLFKKADSQCTKVYQAVENTLGGSLDLESALYTLQEDVIHGTITKVTGITIPHSYIEVTVCGQVLPIDPPVVYNDMMD